tara:strand:+ start:377 stop:574 length:198 start_codon:yes stop_codon:yes gene_type:complete
MNDEFVVKKLPVVLIGNINVKINEKIIEISKLLYNLFFINEIIIINIKVKKIKYPINPLSEIISE